MTLLGFDTSTNATSAAVLRSDGDAFEHDPGPAALLGRPGHAAELMPAVKRVMDEAGTGWDDIDAIAVGVGPGTFTGLRIGIATARALAHARAIRAAPGRLARRARRAASTAPARACALIDARRGELFAALHAPTAVRAGSRSSTRPTSSPSASAEHFAGARTPLAAGDGSIRFREVLEAAGVEVPPDDSPLHLVRALHICRLAGGIPATPPETVLPLYLREPDAKPQIPQ